MSIEVTDATFEMQVLNSELPVLVKFWAPWCGPCRAITPIVEELGSELDGQIIVANVNIDDNPDIPVKYAVRSVPTFMLFKNGELVEQISGAITKNALKELATK